MAFEKIIFKNKQEPAVSAQNLNLLQDNIEEAIGSSSGAPIGSGMDYYGTTAPAGYMFANGAAISRTEYASLFQIIGTTYGAGDGSTTFNLPDKRSRVSVMLDTSDGNFNQLGKKIGSNTHTLTVSELPAHSHSVLIKQATDSALNATGNWNGQPMRNADTGINTSSTGNGAAHNIIQKSYVCNYIIKVK